MKVEKDKFFYDRVEEIKEKGHFFCSNKELWDMLYDELKPQLPTLYKWSDCSFMYLNVIEPNQTNNLVRLIEKRQELKDKIKEIEFIFEQLGLDLKELGVE